MPARIKPRKSCLVCNSPDRHEIEAARVAGVSLDALAKKCGISRDAIWRHTSRHVSDAAKAAYLGDVPLAEVAERAAKEGGSILSYLALVRSNVMQQMLIAAGCNDGHRVATLAGKATEVLAMIGKFSGELSELRTLNVTNNVAFVNSPAFTKLEGMLLDRLKAHPAALAAVVDGLRELEDEDTATGSHRPPMVTIDARPAHASA